MRLALLLGVLGLLIMVLESRSDTDLMMVHNKSQHLALAAQELYGMPASNQAEILWNYDKNWHLSAEADCQLWTLTLSRPLADRNMDAMLNKVLPHEFGHLVHCFLHGGVGAFPHGQRWQKIVVALGGDPNFK